MSEISKEELQIDELFLGMTRPATYWGVPLVAFLLEMFTVIIVFLGSGNPLWLALALPIHFVLYLISATDPGRFDAWRLWLMTFGRTPNILFWRSAASYSPLRVKRYDID